MVFDEGGDFVATLGDGEFGIKFGVVASGAESGAFASFDAAEFGFGDEALLIRVGAGAGEVLAQVDLIGQQQGLQEGFEFGGIHAEL